MIPINHAHTDDARLRAAQEIFLSGLPSGQGLWGQLEQMKGALNYWDMFVSHPIASMRLDESDVEYIESRYLQLRQRAFEWQTNYRLLALEAKIEALENPEAVRP